MSVAPKPPRAGDGKKDYGFSSVSREVAARKFGSSNNIAGGSTALTGYLSIPCSSLQPFSLQKDSDFKQLSEEKFQDLVASIKMQGVIEAITVRPLPDDPERYEIISGHHRWRASKEAGNATVPAHVLQNCTDDEAIAIFTITNLMRRDNSIMDLVNGWWHYLKVTKYKKEDDIQQMILDGIITAEVVELAKKNNRTMRRYAKLHDLSDALLLLVDQKNLGIFAGEQLAYISLEKQEQLLPYKRVINDFEKAKKLRALAEGRYKNPDADDEILEWNDTNIQRILFPSDSKTDSLHPFNKKIAGVIRKHLPPSMYGKSPEIIDAALELYKKTHPEEFDEQNWTK